MSGHLSKVLSRISSRHMSGLSPWLSGLSVESGAGGVPGEEAGEPAPGSKTGRLTSGSVFAFFGAFLNKSIGDTVDTEKKERNQLIRGFLS